MFSHLSVTLRRFPQIINVLEVQLVFQPQLLALDPVLVILHGVFHYLTDWVFFLRILRYNGDSGWVRLDTSFVGFPRPEKSDVRIILFPASALIGLTSFFLFGLLRDL